MTDMVMPLILHMECTATEGEMNGNVVETIKRGYKPLAQIIGTASGSVSLCGAGPSLGERIADLKGDVFAVNSAIGYLLEHGVAPKWAMIWDCAELCEQFAVPHPDVTYLIGSRCHPKVFERLRDCKVIVWHAAGDHNIKEFLAEKKVEEPMINGGTTGVTRGIYLAYALGYRDFHIFGADSSYKNGASHVAGSLVHEQHMHVRVGGKWFETTPQWAAQIEEIKLMYPMFKHSPLAADMTAYDDGMFGWVMGIMKKDEEQALINAIHTMKLREEKNGEAVPGSPGTLPPGTIKALHEQAPHLAAGAMKSLQPLEGAPA